MTRLTRRIAMAAAALLLVAGATGPAEAGLINFTHSGISIFPGEPGNTTGSGSFAFPDPRTVVALADLTAFSYKMDVTATFGPVPTPRQSTFTFGLADLIAFSATLGPDGVPTSLSLRTRPVPASNPAFVPESFVVLSLGPNGAATFNPTLQQLSAGTVTITTTPVPEPSTLALGGIGLAGLALDYARRKRAVG